MLPNTTNNFMNRTQESDSNFSSDFRASFIKVKDTAQTGGQKLSAFFKSEMESTTSPNVVSSNYESTNAIAQLLNVGGYMDPSTIDLQMSQ